MNANLTIVLQALKKSPLAARVKVFGSYAKQMPDPKDIDVVVEFSVLPTDSERAELNRLLSLARHHYGVLDIFVLQPHSPLLVRNDLATGWQRAKNATQIKLAIKNDGILLDDIAFPPKTRAFPRR